MVLNIVTFEEKFKEIFLFLHSQSYEQQKCHEDPEKAAETGGAAFLEELEYPSQCFQSPAQ